MASGFFRELKHYTLYDISKELKTDMDETKRLVGLLKKYGIVKTVNKIKPEYENLSNRDMIIADVTEDTPDAIYAFDFVGVVVLEEHVFKCYPKYISSTKEPVQQLKKVLKVIEKYNSKEQLIFLYNGEYDNKIFNRLSVTLHLLEEYFSYGLYSNHKDIVETNGVGEVLWDRTIHQTFALIQNNRPCYVDLQTYNKVDNDMDYFKRLHECILTSCSRELKQKGLLDLFDIRDVELTNTAIEDFGDEDYILYRLQNEIKEQFITRRKNLLKTLYTYIAIHNTDNNDVSLSLYGTNSFNLVWESVCAENFGSILYESLENLEKKHYLPLPLSDKYNKQKKLINIIDRPVWHMNTPNVYDDKTDSLKPDLVCSYQCNDEGDYCFGIFDAKYYQINFKNLESGCKVTGQPGIGDVTKQYLYQLAFDDFITKQGFRYVQNMFLCPQEESDKDFGYVEMKMFQNIGDKKLQDIAIVKLCAEEMYDCYIAGKQIVNLAEYMPQVTQKSIMKQSFAVYHEAEIKPNRKLIYPKQLKKEIGAKLIYDAICPVASGTYYGFHPYEEKDRSKAAEEQGKTYGRCNQIADAAIQIEKLIKELNDDELQDVQIIKILLKKCFEGKADVDLIVEENNMEKLCERVLELIRSVYLLQ